MLSPVCSARNNASNSLTGITRYCTPLKVSSCQDSGMDLRLAFCFP